MAAGPVQLDFRHSVQHLTADLPSVSVLRSMQARGPEIGASDSLTHPAGNVCCWDWQAACGEEGMPSEQQQESLWRRFFSDPTQWWDKRRSKPTPRHPDFRHKVSKVALWLNNRHKPPWVESQLATWDSGMKTASESEWTSVEGQGSFGKLGALDGHSEVGMCRKLCEDGRIIDAVHALNILVQRGCYVPNNLFYHLLKRCISRKELVLGRRIHALSIKSGYEGDSFLATHLIGLYASHAWLEEAMRVFTTVPLPDAYNWATIILAYARHGDAAEAIRLYGQMRESSAVEPDDRIYAAVLTACATAGDLVAGKDVHRHILARQGQPDLFVQTCLVHMFAKCGSLEDACSVFDRLPVRNVVSLTSIIAGYVQQGMGEKALCLYSRMQQEGLTDPDSVTFVCLLQACASVGIGALDQGKQLHEQIEQRGLQDEMVLGMCKCRYWSIGSRETAPRTN